MAQTLWHIKSMEDLFAREIVLPATSRLGGKSLICITPQYVSCINYEFIILLEDSLPMLFWAELECTTVNVPALENIAACIGYWLNMFMSGQAVYQASCLPCFHVYF